MANTLERRRGVYTSAALGETLTYQELSRVEYLAAQAAPAGHTVQGIDGAAYFTEMGMAIRDAAVISAGVVDPATGARRWTSDAIVEWPNRADLWAEVRELAQAILDLSEVGPGALKSGDPAPDARGAAGPDRRGDGEPGAGAGADPEPAQS